jgi:predicted transcriptional regulator
MTKDTIIKIPEFIKNLLDLNFTDKLVLSQIDYLNNDKGCTIKNNTLAAYVGKEKRTIQGIVKKLIDLGYVARTLVNGFERTLTTTFDKISKPLEKVAETTKELVQGGVKLLHGGVQKMHDIYNKKQYKSFYKKSLNMYQRDDETIAEFETRCSERNKEGDVNIIKGYNKRINYTYNKANQTTSYTTVTTNIDNNHSNTSNSTSMINRMKAQMIAGKNKVIRELHSMKQIKYAR